MRWDRLHCRGRGLHCSSAGSGLWEQETDNTNKLKYFYSHMRVFAVRLDDCNSSLQIKPDLKLSLHCSFHMHKWKAIWGTEEWIKIQFAGLLTENEEVHMLQWYSCSFIIYMSGGRKKMDGPVAANKWQGWKHNEILDLPIHHQCSHHLLLRLDLTSCSPAFSNQLSNPINIHQSIRAGTIISQIISLARMLPNWSRKCEHEVNWTGGICDRGWCNGVD